MRALLVVLTIGALAVSCSSDERGRAATGQPPTSHLATERSDATELARQIDCQNQVREAVLGLESNEPPPTDNVHCNIGDASLSILTYAVEQDVLAALRATDQYCGFRLAGERWIIVVNTRRTAEDLQSRVGGRVVTLSGCTP